VHVSEPVAAALAGLSAPQWASDVMPPILIGLVPTKGDEAVRKTRQEDLRFGAAVSVQQSEQASQRAYIVMKEETWALMRAALRAMMNTK
jgi:hypothetical protein